MFLFFKKILQTKNYKPETSRGFSMLELIVVIAIFLIITAVVVADIPNFRSKSSLDLTVSEVATYIRGAQVYGASQKGGEVASAIFGINLNKGLSTFFLFRGNNKDDRLENYETPGFKVSAIKVFLSDGGNSEYDALDIVFKANTYTGYIGTQLEPSFYLNYGEEGESPYLSVYFVEIKISSLQNEAMSSCLRIYNNGQITPASCGL